MWRDNTVELYLCTFLEVNYIYLHFIYTSSFIAIQWNYFLLRKFLSSGGAQEIRPEESHYLVFLFSSFFVS